MIDPGHAMENEREDITGNNNNRSSPQPQRPNQREAVTNNNNNNNNLFLLFFFFYSGRNFRFRFDGANVNQITRNKFLYNSIMGLSTFRQMM